MSIVCTIEPLNEYFFYIWFIDVQGNSCGSTRTCLSDGNEWGGPLSE